MTDTTGENTSPFQFIEIHDTGELRRVLRSMGITPADERPAGTEQQR